MQIIENLKVKEKVYQEELENGLTILCIPRKGIQKKYIIWGTNYGSIDNHFIVPETGEEVMVPDGVAHFLEHKMFEQENGKNSLDVLTALGVNANAYTTNNHTAYLFEATDSFYPALDELMDYVQHPYFTDENVEKEKGIIGQEIKMYDDSPANKVYMNALEAMYHKNPVKINITGTIETISKINKETLYQCSYTFYHPSNMCLVVCGDFNPEDIIGEIKKRVIAKENQNDIKRIYEEEPDGVVKEKVEATMEVSNPIFVIGIKDDVRRDVDMVKKDIAIQILLYLLIGKSSELFKTQYEEGNIMVEPSLDYEFSKEYAHIMISGQAENPEKVWEALKEKVEKMKQEGIQDEDFIRVRKLIYGGFVKEYNDIADVAGNFLADYFKGINSFEYIEKCSTVTKEYVMQILKDVWKPENMVLSVIKGNNK